MQPMNISISNSSADMTEMISTAFLVEVGSI